MCVYHNTDRQIQNRVDFSIGTNIADIRQFVIAYIIISYNEKDIQSTIYRIIQNVFIGNKYKLTVD